jgi:hypothetical protein
MTRRKHLIERTHVAARAGVGVLAACLLFGCTEAGLYQWKTTPYQANKLTVSGTVCSDDLHQSNFPIKILYVIDVTNALKTSNNDPNGMRGKAIEEMIGVWGKNPNYHFGIIAFGSKAKNMLTDATGLKPIGFSRDFSKLSNAVAEIKSGGGATLSEVAACRAGRCRDIRAGLSLANSVITGDLLAEDPGVAARTTYVVIMFAGGPPVPPMGRCPCRDKDEEKKGGIWEGCAWTDCECDVTCDTAISNCSDDGKSCLPICTPSCDDDEFCDPSLMPWQCVTGAPVSLPTVPPLSSAPSAKPDTFTFHEPPPTSAGACKGVTCVYAAGGNPESCEEKVLVLDVRELREFVMKNGAGQFQFHTTYLPDGDAATRQTNDPYYPPGPAPCAGDAAADEARSVRLLSQLAYAGGGGFSKFITAAQIPDGFLKIGRDIYSTSDALVFKELVVFNRNVLPQSDGIYPDTDSDGLVDALEEKLGTCISDEDTDGDGVSDAIEVKIASDPLVPQLKSDRPECIDLKSSQEPGDDPCNPGQSKVWTRFEDDKDGDELNACEERLMGTDDTLFDTDADGIPDRIEFLVGTNYLAVDPLLDSDLDGLVNRDEVRGHTDPRSNDAQSQLDLAYRYEEVNEGLKQVLGFTQPKSITGVTVKNVSPQTTPGVGRLKFNPGPPPTLEWRDYGDMDTGGNFGPAVDVSKPNKDGYRLTSCRMVAGQAGQCTPESANKFITVSVEGPAAYPPSVLIDKINISSAMRNCLRFTVRNITLMETGVDRVLKTAGNNIVEIYFAEAPQRAKTGYGIFRIASVRLNYTKGPPEIRTPDFPEITFTDEDFVLDISQ